MKAEGLEKRTLADLGHPVAAGVLHAIRLLEECYGASDYHDSRHAKAPMWIFKLPRYGNAEVGVRMNKRDTTLYVRDTTLYVRDTTLYVRDRHVMVNGFVTSFQRARSRRFTHLMT